ncbi:MAG: hypothetical protein N3E52_00165 [Candidatus Bathyarchaeota archaeon]|nr:hypothetical protein [Candidatus Bathyarchaeota archaeon]
MPAVLRVRPEELDTVEKRQAYTVSVVGCRQIGILYAIAFAEVGYKVIYTDLDQSLVRSIEKGRPLYVSREVAIKLKRLTKTGRLTSANDLKSAVSQSDIILIAIQAKFDEKIRTDYSEIEKACKQIGNALRRNTLVIYVGITGLGAAEGVIKEKLESTSGFKVGDSFGFAYNPIYLPYSQKLATIREQKLKIAASDETSLASASVVLETITGKAIQRITDIKTAEAAALFAITKKDVDMALTNELAIFCEKAGIDYNEILRVLGIQDIDAAPTISEENYRDGVNLLLESAENLTTKLRIPSLARQINEQMTAHAVNLVQDALRSCGKTLRRARIALLGNVQFQTAAEMLVQLLEKKGAKLNLYDPAAMMSETTGLARLLKKSVNEAVEGTDCIILINPLDIVKRLNLKKLHTIVKTPAAFIDLTGIIEPQKVEKEGFVYRGIGRGARKT